jgi:hypothetical protein
LSANAGISATNNLIGSSSNRISLVSTYGQIQIYGQKIGFRDGSYRIEDFYQGCKGILGLLSVLACVRSVSTSVAHFACALGVPTYVTIAQPRTARRANIFPFKWICRSTPGRTPWYPTAQVTEA